ncbi:fc1a2d07-82d1-4487-8f97-bef22edef94a [Sclerotinia trifoliorum]|uniref:Fc1a2d07-82d1-4487-8f97-bef22edef94a n=1 Tax=Sclerotinia trifoliorum TaxID=28548 RepID=A0A8H2ZLS6_9HELO|nr:fc1a2d07-82d1-4487-8f97-bef22edef94a [Sclerotinia trifoliorum]
MSTTKLIPSRPLLRYLNERILSTTRPFCRQVTQNSSANSFRRSILFRPSQQCRHIMLSRIAERTQNFKLQADNHKILDFAKLSVFDNTKFQSQKMILWRETETRPNSRPHVFLGVMSLRDAMQKYLGDRENVILDPGVGTSWMLVSRIGFENEAKVNPALLAETSEQVGGNGLANLHEYLLVKRKSWMVPKPGQRVKHKGGRGNAKLIHLQSNVNGHNMSVMMAKAYYYLETHNFNAEFHIHFSNRSKYSENEMLERLMKIPGGLALHPQVIQRQLPTDTGINIRPRSDGREMVWVVGKSERRIDEKWVLMAEKKMAELEGTPGFIMKRGKEMVKDRKWRLKQDKEEIVSLRKQGESFGHVLERQREIHGREKELRAMFKEMNVSRRQKARDKQARRLQERLRNQARRRAMSDARLEQKRTFRMRWERRRKESLRVMWYQRNAREAMRASFLARRNARKTELRAKSMSSTLDHYTKRIQIKARLEKSKRKVRLIQHKEPARDIAKRALSLRSPRSAARNILQIERQKSLNQKSTMQKREQRELALSRKMASPFRSKFEDVFRDGRMTWM